MTINLTKTLQPQTHTYTSTNLSLKVDYADKKTTIIFQTLIPAVTTGSFPNTFNILNNKYPQVFETKCTNYAGQPFCEEVKNTEIGHMFEHILIQNLKEIKTANCDDPIHFSAVTEWDWLVNPRGMYVITIEGNCNYFEFLGEAILNSIRITDAVLNSCS